MTIFIVGFVLGIFMGAFAANKKFRTRIIRDMKRLTGLNEPKNKKVKARK